MDDQSSANAPEYTHSRREILGEESDGKLILGERESLDVDTDVGTEERLPGLDADPTKNTWALPFDALEAVRLQVNETVRSEDRTPIWKLRRETVQANRDHGIVFRG